jgi:translation initiation factor 5B
MPPKKKANKKGNDDWESELGETIDPKAAADKGAKDEGADQDGAEEGEDPQQVDGQNTPQTVDLAAKAPEEANPDEEDVFSAPVPKPKAVKGRKVEHAEEELGTEDDGEEGGRMKTKKEKEKEKKEREKLRKKEQVYMTIPLPFLVHFD